MSLTKFLYGVEKPTHATKAFYNILIVLFAFAIHGFNADFIVTQSWSSISHYLTIFTVTICFVLLCIFRSKGELDILPENTIGKMLLGIVGGVFILYILIYTTLAHGLSDLITRNFGIPYTTTTTLNKFRYTGRRSCKFQLTGPYLEKAFPEYVCISESEFLDLPSTPFDAEINGSTTFLGSHIHGWRQIGHPSLK